MNKAQAGKEVERLWKALHDHSKSKIKEIEELCDKFGIVKYFNGLPPFDEYGNSGHYLPRNRETGEGWISSEEMDSEYGYGAEAGSWHSSSDRCS